MFLPDSNKNPGPNQRIFNMLQVNKNNIFRWGPVSTASGHRVACFHAFTLVKQELKGRISTILHEVECIIF